MSNHYHDPNDLSLLKEMAKAAPYEFKAWANLDAASDKHNPILRGTNRVDSIGYTTEAFGREAVSFIEKHRDEP